jgi:hypothetical protein
MRENISVIFGVSAFRVERFVRGRCGEDRSPVAMLTRPAARIAGLVRVSSKTRRANLARLTTASCHSCARVSSSRGKVRPVVA